MIPEDYFNQFPPVNRPTWTDAERAEWEEIKEQHGVYARGMQVMSIHGYSLNVVPCYHDGKVWRTLCSPIVPLSIADAETLVAELQAAIEARKKHLSGKDKFKSRQPLKP